MASKLRTRVILPPGNAPDSEASIEERFEAFESLSRSADRDLQVTWEESPTASAAAAEPFDRQYVYATAWAARVLAASKPKRHVDISPSVCFAAIASAFVPVDFYEYRALNLGVSGLRTGTVDFAKLPFRTGSIASLSCIGLVEQIGLGRFGEPLDPTGDVKAMAELKRVLAPDGSLLLVCPVGKPRVAFDQHRVYAFGQILDAFDGLDLEEFSLIPDTSSGRDFLVNPDERVIAKQDCGRGCFWFRKPGK